jgi:hypothetical protein
LENANTRPIIERKAMPRARGFTPRRFRWKKSGRYTALGNVGMGEGIASIVGATEGLKVGAKVGKCVGSRVGAGTGAGVGLAVGSAVGLKVGSGVGSGVIVGFAVGSGVGGRDGVTDGKAVEVGGGVGETPLTSRGTSASKAHAAARHLL